jgi:hypothetical protein
MLPAVVEVAVVESGVAELAAAPDRDDAAPLEAGLSVDEVGLTLRPCSAG